MKQNTEDSKRNKTHQDPTWKAEGYLGAIATDRFGDTYVLKSAKVNMLYNKPKDQNNIYKIDSKTGKMSFFMSLKGNGWTNPQNAFGGMGSFYDCDNDHLIVTSIMGSTQKEEIGRIYVVDIAKKTQRVLLDNIDAMGVTISNTDGIRKLYYAKARESMIYSVQISNDNQLIGNPTPVISLENLGPRGTDKGRRLRFDANGVLKVYGVDFLYNLSAPSEKKQTVYKFKYVPQKRQWQLIQIQ